MPGIVGLVDTESRGEELSTLLQRMCESIKHEDWYITDEYTVPPVALGRVHLGIFNPEKQPIFNEDRSVFIMMEGEITTTSI